MKSTVNASSEGGRSETVSYTHLDVYKRQVEGIDTYGLEVWEMIRRAMEMGYC